MRRLAFFFVFVVAIVCPGTSQEQASVSAAELQLKPGETFSFTLTLDKTPNYRDAGIQYFLQTPNGGSNAYNCGQTVPGQKAYQCEFKVPAAARAGTYTVTGGQLFNGAEFLRFSSTPVSFEVVSTEDLQFPDRAEITVNPSQAQLLRRANVDLKNRVQLLKASITEMEGLKANDPLKPVLEGSVQEALKALRKTEEEFEKLATAEDQKSTSRVFFGDLRASYENVLSQVSRRPTASLSSKDSLLLVSSQQRQSYPLLAQAALWAFEQNELAYNVVADRGSLTFDLEVNSIPAGATLSFFRRGDPPRLNPNPTNSTLHSLPYAIWIVKLEKPGYRAMQREHDPFREPNHVLTVELQVAK